MNKLFFSVWNNKHHLQASDSMLRVLQIGLQPLFSIPLSNDSDAQESKAQPLGQGPAAAELGLWSQVCLRKVQDGLFHYQIIPTIPPQHVSSLNTIVHQIWDSANSGWHTTVPWSATLPIRLQNTINWKVCHNSKMLKCVCMYTDLHTHIYLRLPKYSNPTALQQVIPKKVL